MKTTLLSKHEVVATNYHYQCALLGLKESQQILAKSFPQLNLSVQPTSMTHEEVDFRKQHYIGIWHWHGRWSYYGIDKRVLKLIENEKWDRLNNFRSVSRSFNYPDQNIAVNSNGTIRIEQWEAKDKRLEVPIM